MFQVSGRINVEHGAPVVIDLFDLPFFDQAHAKSGVTYQALNLPIMEIHHSLNNWKAGAAIYRMGWLQTICPPTDDNISLVFQTNHISNDLGIKERHITGSEEDVLSLSLPKARVQSTKAPAVWNKIANNRYFRWQLRTVLSDDHAYLLKQLTENRAAPIKESPFTDDDKAFVFSHPSTLPASQQYARHIGDHEYVTYLKKKRG